MQHYTSLTDIHLSGTWLTIGSFDGVHRGHQELLSGLVSGARAAGNPAVVLTFFPHPSVVLRAQQGRFYLSSPEEKAALLGEQGVDAVVTLEFTRELASVRAPDFMYQLQDHFQLQQLWIGFNFALGRGREGDPSMLRRLGDLLGYSLNVVPPFELDGEVVSSSLVRSRLLAGEVARAGQLLGRPYSVSGDVVPGDGRGRTIGIPTANLNVWPERVIPAAGVYAGWAWTGGSRYPAVTNVGVRPTFTDGNVATTVETHILDFHQDLYGKDVRFDFVEYLRGEERFPSVDALIEQIHADIQRARELLNHET